MRGVGKETLLSHHNFFKIMLKIASINTIVLKMDDSSCISFLWLHTPKCPYSLMSCCPLGALWTCSQLPWRQKLGKWHSAPKLNETVMWTVLKSINFKLLRWQFFPPPPEKAISHLMTAGCDSNCISLEMTWWQEGMRWRLKRYYTDSHSNSVSDSETDDLELEKMKQPKIMSQSVLITNVNSHLHSSYTWELHCMLRINLQMLFLLSHTKNIVLGVHFNALYYLTAWNAVNVFFEGCVHPSMSSLAPPLTVPVSIRRSSTSGTRLKRGEFGNRGL